MKSSLLGDEHFEVEVPGPPGWVFYDGLVTHLCKMMELISSKEI